MKMELLPKTPPAPSKIETPAALIDDKHLESMLGKEIHTTADETVGNVTDILRENARLAAASWSGHRFRSASDSHEIFAKHR